MSQVSYPEFVAQIGLENTPPVDRNTILTWINQGEITHGSVILDCACSTGFSLRSLIEETGCQGIGFDISNVAIKAATRTSTLRGLSSRAKFFVHDLTKPIPADGKVFTDATLGCSLAFVHDKVTALRCIHEAMSNSSGLLHTANFCYRSEPSSKLLDAVEAVVGFRPNTKWTSSYWFYLFSNCGYKLINSM